MRRPPDRGSASLWLLVVGLLLVSAGLFAAAVGAVMIARHRATTAADLGALAGARWALWGPDTACPAAAEIVVANGGRLTGCRVEGADVIVTVEVPVVSLPSPAATGAARAEARAGPLRARAAPPGPTGPVQPALFVLRSSSARARAPPVLRDPGVVRPRTAVERRMSRARGGTSPAGASVEVAGRHASRREPMVRCPEGGTPGVSGALAETIGRDA